MNTTVSREDCVKILYKFSTSPLNLLNYEISQLGDKIMGFMGDHFRLTIYYSKAKNDNKTFKSTFFVKTKPTNPKHNEEIEIMGLFQKESLIFKHLLTELMEVSRKQFAPICYYIKENQFIVLEDLGSKGFEVSSSEYINLDMCKSLLSTIAMFHASTIILEEKRSSGSDKYRLENHYKEETKESTFSFIEGHPRNKWYKTVIQCLTTLGKYFTNNEDVIERLHDYLLDGLPKSLKPSREFRNVLTHDDLWRNNFMFNNKQECVLVDFQLTRYTPPIFDVLLAIYVNMEIKDVKNNMEMLLDYYYTQFTHELTHHNVDANSILSKSDFLKSKDIYNLPALTEACMYGSIVFVSNEIGDLIINDFEAYEKFNVDRPSFLVNEFENNHRFRERFGNLLSVLIEKFV